MPHLKKAHPKLSVYDYLTEYDAPLASEAGFKTLREQAETDAAVARPIAETAVWELFDLSKWDGKDVTRKWVMRKIKHFTDKKWNTPEVDSDYVFQENVLKRILTAYALEERNRIWLHGVSGTGKTTHQLQVAARLGYGVERVNGDPNITRSQLLGSWVVGVDKTMVFRYGPIPRAMKAGDLLLIDEIDQFSPPILAIFRSVLEDPSTLNLLEAGEVITATKGFRVGAGANTAGAGDESGLYMTCRALSVADRQRFSIWARVHYMHPRQEAAMLLKKFEDSGITEIEIRRFLQVTKAMRERHVKGEFEESFSPRELINWVEKTILLGDPMEAAAMCFIDRYQSPEVRIAVEKLVEASWADTNTAPPELDELVEAGS